MSDSEREDRRERNGGGEGEGGPIAGVTDDGGPEVNDIPT